MGKFVRQIDQLIDLLRAKREKKARAKMELKKIRGKIYIGDYYTQKNSLYSQASGLLESHLNQKQLRFAKPYLGVICSFGPILSSSSMLFSFSIIRSFKLWKMRRGINSLLSHYGIEARLLKHKPTSADKALNGKFVKNIIFISGLFYPPEMKIAATDHMGERYEKYIEQVGSAKAKWWLMSDVLHSHYPLLVLFAQSKLIKGLKVIGLYQIYKYFSG